MSGQDERDERDEIADRALDTRLDALPRSIDPPSEAAMWRGIAARVAVTEARRPPRRGRFLAYASLAAAVAVAAAVTAVRIVSHSGPIAQVQPGPSAPAPIAPEPSLVISPLPAEEELGYRTAVHALRDAFAKAREDLPPKTQRAVDDDLRLIESAIEATRAALAQSPDDPVLRGMLRDAYQQEIDVLSDVIDLTTRT